MAKKHKCPEFENHERWLVSYADMVTLLFAVFVVLYAIQMAGQKDELQVAGSMQESFNKPLEDIPIDRRVAPDDGGRGVLDKLAGSTMRQSIRNKKVGSQRLIKIINSEKMLIETKLENRLYGPEKFRDKTKPGFERIVQVTQTSDGLQLQLLARHFYDAGQVKMKASALPDLNKIIGILKELGRDVTIKGHTDSSKPRGVLDNWAISALRASNVVKYMISKGFPSTMLSAVGYADTRPIASSKTSYLNRRIEIQINYDDPGL